MTLKLNAHGDEVKAWQEFLRGQGLFDGTVDGSFGPLTLEGTKAFQRQHDLLADGVAGTITLREASRLGLPSQPELPGGGGMALGEPWVAPTPADDSALFVVLDPRVITAHRVGALPCPANPPPPVGWAYWNGKVPPALGALAVEVENDSTRFPMGSFVQTVRDGVKVAARVEWHNLKGKTGEKGCFRGTNLFRPIEPG